MNSWIKKLVWLVFGMVAVLTLFVYSRLWMISQYYIVLALLGALNMFLGAWLIFDNRFKYSVILIIILFILISQWWVIELYLVQLIWKLKGMGP